jgi:CHAD domain-containing protein
VTSSDLHQLRRSESPMAGLRRITRTRVHDLGSSAAERPLEERIHASRVATKTLRAYLDLLRPAIGNTVFRDIERPLRKAAHALSAHRDRDVAVATLEILAKRVGRKRRVALANASRALTKASGAPKRIAKKGRALEALNRALEDAVDDFAELTPTKRDWELLGPGYASTYRQCRKELARWRASKRTEDSHRLRRHVKYLGYQLTLLEATNPEAIVRQTTALKDLGHRLGRLHDCANLELLMRNEKVRRRISAEDRAQIRRAARKWERDLTRECLPLAEPLFASTPEQFTSRLENDWQRARQAHPAS